MGPLLVADTSIIIDLVRGDVLEAAFRTQFSLAVPDLLFERELAVYEGPALKQLGLQVHGLDGDGIRLADRFRQSARGVSLVDAFALALAKRLEAILLTGDGALRALATGEAVECHGLLWLFDAMEEQRVLSRRSLQTALERLTAHVQAPARRGAKAAPAVSESLTRETAGRPSRSPRRPGSRGGRSRPSSTRLPGVAAPMT